VTTTHETTTTSRVADGLKVTATHSWRSDVAEADRAADLAASADLVAAITADGATGMRLGLWRTPFGVFAGWKVSGPPRWRFPKARCSVGRTETGRPCITAAVGWRFTVLEGVWMSGRRQ
jgi:hypothetical protein